MSKIIYVPSTPAGSFLIEHESATEEEAWKKLLEATRHMPYRTVQDLKDRGYTVDAARPVRRPLRPGSRKLGLSKKQL